MPGLAHSGNLGIVARQKMAHGCQTDPAALGLLMPHKALERSEDALGIHIFEAPAIVPQLNACDVPGFGMVNV